MVRSIVVTCATEGPDAKVGNGEVGESEDFKYDGDCATGDEA